MTSDVKTIVENWIASPTAKEPAQAMIAVVKADSVPMPLLAHGIMTATWHKTSHASKWARLFTDATTCEGFHKSDGWWLETLAKLPNDGDIRALPVLVAREATKYIESEWKPEWPLPEIVVSNFEQRSVRAFNSLIEILGNSNPAHPVTQGVLLWLSTMPRWSGVYGESASVMEIAAKSWPQFKDTAATVAGLFEESEEQIRQFAVMVSRPQSPTSNYTAASPTLA